MSELGESLCVDCGMCCTGHIFPVLAVEPGERSAVEGIGFTVRDTPHGARGNLPCIHWDKKCTIYGQFRPKVCGGFSCKLLKRVEAGKVDMAAAVKITRELKAMAAEIRAKVLPESDPRHFDLIAVDEWCAKQWKDRDSLRENGDILVKSTAYWKSVQELIYDGSKKGSAAKIPPGGGDFEPQK